MGRGATVPVHGRETLEDEGTSLLHCSSNGRDCQPTNGPFNCLPWAYFAVTRRTWKGYGRVFERSSAAPAGSRLAPRTLLAFACEQRGLHAVLDMQFRQDVAQMLFHRALSDGQAVGNIAIAQPGGHTLQHLLLAFA